MEFVAGVAACSTGIAHTYMMAEAIKRACKRQGLRCKVETQGAVGVENELSAQDVADADLIVLATDVRLEGADRFEGLERKVVRIKPGALLAKPESIFDDVQGQADGE